MEHQINLRLAVEDDVDALVNFNLAMARERSEELAVETSGGGAQNLRNDHTVSTSRRKRGRRIPKESRLP